MKKFELTAEFVTNVFGKKLFRVKALVAFGNVEKGELGGFIEKEDNLSHAGNAWVSDDACVIDNACVSDDALVSGNALVRGNARVSGNAWVSDNADFAVVTGFGRYFRETTFFRCKDKILRVQCGCFYGDLAQFREIVKKTHGDSKYAKEYLAIADLMELHFSDEKEKQEADE
ncbi:MAG: hypothetical protein MR845_03455 [Subdoligranulum variabile]|nr:hypothetical protein [Subdoligranulum variabile]